MVAIIILFSGKVPPPSFPPETAWQGCRGQRGTESSGGVHVLGTDAVICLWAGEQRNCVIQCTKSVTGRSVRYLILIAMVL